MLARIVSAILRAAFGIVAALVAGILRAPRTAWERRVIDVGRATAAEVVDLRHRVLRAGRPRDAAIWSGDDDPQTRHWAARQGDRIVAVASVMRAPSEQGPGWQLRGMAVLPELQGRGVGVSLLRQLEADVGEPLWCNARVSAAPFYARSGWRTVGEAFDVPGIGPHLRMVKP